MWDYSLKYYCVMTVINSVITFYSDHYSCIQYSDMVFHYCWLLLLFIIVWTLVLIPVFLFWWLHDTVTCCYWPWLFNDDDYSDDLIVDHSNWLHPYWDTFGILVDWYIVYLFLTTGIRWCDIWWPGPHYRFDILILIPVFDVCWHFVFIHCSTVPILLLKSPIRYCCCYCCC